MTKWISTTENDGSVANWDVPDDHVLVAGQEFIREPEVIGQVSGPTVAEPTAAEPDAAAEPAPTSDDPPATPAE